MQKRRKRVPNYMRKLQYLWKLGVVPPNGFTKVDILHDDWCPHWADKPCTCNPDVKVRYTLDGARQN